MNTIAAISFIDNRVIVEMNDGKIIESLIKCYPNLSKGTKNQLDNYQIKGNGRWVHWEELDEDLSAEGFFSLIVK